MSNYDRDEREDREDRDGRDGRGGRRPARRGTQRQQQQVVYVYRYQHSPRKPIVQNVVTPKLGEIINTKDGPAKVVEVFWRTALLADVLLRRVETEKLTTPEKLAVKDAAKKSQAKKPQVKPAPKPQVKPALKPQVKPQAK